MSAEEFHKFCNLGYFTIRRTHKFWSGTWTDMVIEQNLMRAFKTEACMRVCNAMETLCRLTHVSSEQHVELQDSRESRDIHDFRQILSWFEAHSPFDETVQDKLISLSTGIVADLSINFVTVSSSMASRHKTE
ncbi:hypothetical protein RN001_011228 [Aquatica leii]|uniref:Uncharacterized protein n=1 Tax=Aquatica leii TaxID=1421715 RepID=A0AAN7PXK4_9COLE|nr:hypothetical protein RN001_011228 [Aquatica leii]